MKSYVVLFAKSRVTNSAQFARDSLGLKTEHPIPHSMYSFSSGKIHSLCWLISGLQHVLSKLMPTNSSATCLFQPLLAHCCQSYHPKTNMILLWSSLKDYTWFLLPIGKGKNSSSKHNMKDFSPPPHVSSSLASSFVDLRLAHYDPAILNVFFPKYVFPKNLWFHTWKTPSHPNMNSEYHILHEAFPKSLSWGSVLSSALPAALLLPTFLD